MAAVSTSLFALLVGIPFATVFVEQPYKWFAFPLSVWLFWMCFNGGAEMVVKTREEMRVDTEAKFQQGTTLGTSHEDLVKELRLVRQKLNGRSTTAQAIKERTTGRDNAQAHKEEVCKVNPRGQICTNATGDLKTAQERLDEATDIDSLMKRETDLDGKLTANNNAQASLGAVHQDTTLMTAQGVSSYISILEKIPLIKGNIQFDAKTLADRRPMDIALSSEIAAAWGAKFLVALIHGLFSGLRGLVCRRKEEDKQPSEAKVPEIHLPAVSLGDASMHVSNEPNELMQEPMQPMHASIQKRTEPEQKVLRPWRRESVGEWAKVRLSAHNGYRLPKPKAYDDYAAWCRARGEEPVEKNLFGRLITDYGAAKDPKDSRHYYNVALKPELTLVKSMQHA